jgi:hypothetical protein
MRAVTVRARRRRRIPLLSRRGLARSGSRGLIGRKMTRVKTRRITRGKGGGVTL